jgi:hypothetical protein
LVDAASGHHTAGEQSVSVSMVLPQWAIHTPLGPEILTIKPFALLGIKFGSAGY